VIAAIPKVDGEYDLDKLSEYLTVVKREYPQKEDASVLLESDIEYDHLIQVMDTVRSREQRDGNVVTRAALFTAISIGDAP
jgi:biopolymer transport protein ExbD